MIVELGPPSAREPHATADPVRTRVLLLACQTVALGLMMAFLVVPVSALFLNEYGSGALPYVYLIVAGTGVAVSSLMSRAERRLSLAGLAGGVVATYLVAVAVGWVALVMWDGLWVTFPLLVLFPLSIPIGFVLVGSQAGRLLDVRQMKAQFPRVVAGFSVGFAVGRDRRRDPGRPAGRTGAPARPRRAGGGPHARARPDHGSPVPRRPPGRARAGRTHARVPGHRRRPSGGGSC